MKWTMIYTHRFYLSFAVLLVSLFMSFFCLSSDSFATSWTSQNVVSVFPAYSTQVSYSDLGFTSDVFFVPSYVSVHIESSGNTYRGNRHIGFIFRRDGTYNYMFLNGPDYSSVSVYNDITFSSCISNPDSSINSSSIITADFVTPAIFGTISNVTFTFADECLGSSSGITPSGSLSITENGTYDVTNYAEAVVDVPVSSGSGDSDCTYTGILEEIKSAIIFVPAVLLVIYFFYAIYKMIMGGVRR